MVDGNEIRMDLDLVSPSNLIFLHLPNLRQNWHANWHENENSFFFFLILISSFDSENGYKNDTGENEKSFI